MQDNLYTPRTRVCAIYRTPLGCNVNLIRSDLFIYPSRRSVYASFLFGVSIYKQLTGLSEGNRACDRHDMISAGSDFIRT